MAIKRLACFVLISCFIAGRPADASEVDDPYALAKILAEQVCATCHGPHGVGTFQEIPNLAAQTHPYLAGRLRQFRNQSLQKPERHLDLLGIVLIDDVMVQALAHYYANQPAPPPVVRDASLIEAGSEIFGKGIETKGVTPCSTCHSTNAEGFWVIPRLAGQHAGYVERQLKEIQLQLRKAPGMHMMVKGLSLEDIKAVAAFVQSK